MKILKALLLVAFICIFFSMVNNIEKVRKQRVQAENIFVTTQVNKCRKEYEDKWAEFAKKSRAELEWEVRDKCPEKSEACIFGKIQLYKHFQALSYEIGIKNCEYATNLVARSWRDNSIIVSSTIIQQIVGGLYITTANILDGIMGGIIDIIIQYPYSYDFRTFNDLLLKNDLYYKWSFDYDLFDKGGEANWSIRLDDLCRIFANFIVCIVFICLTIRIFSFNFRDSIFEISGECIYFGFWRA